MSSIHVHSERWTRSESAGRALFLIEHPSSQETVWNLLDEPTRAWWISRAQPITDAVQATTA